jgi:hypothetical protein
MQMTKIALAVAATLVAGQAAAAAVTQADILAAKNAGTLQEAWLSGASAPTYNVFAGFALGCDTGTLAVFTNHTAAAKPGSLKDYSAYACQRSGVVSVMYHTIAGGSFNAYAPHVPNDVDGDGVFGTTALQRVKNLATATCGTTSTVTDSSLYGGTTYPVTINCQKVTAATAADGAAALPHGGFSDVEAGLWGVDASAYGTQSSALIGQVFGVAVSAPLYRAMQVDQGIYADLATANASDASFSPANAPNITSAQYAAIIQAGGGYQADWSLLLPNASAADKAKTVYLMRRVATSGTQASSNAFFLKNPCANGSNGGLVSPAVAQGTAGVSPFVVTEDSSSSTLKSNMIAHGAAGNFAIGVLSLENALGTNAAYLKLDGVHPEANDPDNEARNTTVNSNYAFAMEMVNFIPTSAAGTFGATLIGEITTALGAPANCSDVPRGLYLDPQGGACTTGVETARGTKFGNNCSPVQLFF